MLETVPAHIGAAVLKTERSAQINDAQPPGKQYRDDIMRGLMRCSQEHNVQFGGSQVIKVQRLANRCSTCAECGTLQNSMTFLNRECFGPLPPRGHQGDNPDLRVPREYGDQFTTRVTRSSKDPDAGL